MTDSSIGAAFTYLVTNVPAAITAADAAFQVGDGWPPDPNAPRQFVIGRNHPDSSETAAAGSPTLFTLGASRVEETYEIPCFIQVITGGTTDQSVSRKAALVAWNAFVRFLMTDLTLGGALNAGWCQVSQFQIDGTPDHYVGTGRSTLITFALAIKSQYQPLGA